MFHCVWWFHPDWQVHPASWHCGLPSPLPRLPFGRPTTMLNLRSLGTHLHCCTWQFAQIILVTFQPVQGAWDSAMLWGLPCNLPYVVNAKISAPGGYTCKSTFHLFLEYWGICCVLLYKYLLVCNTCLSGIMNSYHIIQGNYSLAFSLRPPHR